MTKNRPQPLPDQEIKQRLQDHPKWLLEGGALHRRLEFPTFLEAMAFVNRVAEAAEAMDHHPDITISWRRVELRLNSHDAGGITPRDFALAGRIDALCDSIH
ncbi:MAG TPA: 4a-hydroxytetrahydrobiopterin dehydratase [Candidatus Polarisedimenticolia bacterium]|nr:4a-hydroxytetrahydrobiopterin dehydratase [Candidatus Polarisedimenticolia bacterium]